MVDVARTFGALLVGGVVSVMFTGVTWAQSVVYIKLFPKDTVGVKSLVLAVWLLDTLHSVFILVSLWNYLITHFGNEAAIDAVPTSLALTIVTTAILTFIVQLFFIYRVFILAKRNYYIACPIAVLACLRLCFACLTSSRFIQLRSITKFVELYSWSFTTGLCLSAAVDVLVTFFMCYWLRRRRDRYSSLNKVLDTLMLYAFENGLLTTVAAMVSLVTWLTMNQNLIFMATHFVILKFYANSLLATLNARADLQRSRGITNHSTHLGQPTENGIGLSRASAYVFPGGARAAPGESTPTDHFGFAPYARGSLDTEKDDHSALRLEAGQNPRRREMDELMRGTCAASADAAALRRAADRPRPGGLRAAQHGRRRLAPGHCGGRREGEAGDGREQREHGQGQFKKPAGRRDAAENIDVHGRGPP